MKFKTIMINQRPNSIWLIITTIYYNGPWPWRRGHIQARLHNPIQTPSVVRDGSAPALPSAYRPPCFQFTMGHGVCGSWRVQYLLSIQSNPTVSSWMKTLLQPQWNFNRWGHASQSFRHSTIRGKTWKGEPLAELWVFSKYWEVLSTKNSHWTV